MLFQLVVVLTDFFFLFVAEGNRRGAFAYELSNITLISATASFCDLRVK
jgi:hypothetical protein